MEWPISWNLLQSLKKKWGSVKWIKFALKNSVRCSNFELKQNIVWYRLELFYFPYYFGIKMGQIKTFFFKFLLF